MAELGDALALLVGARDSFRTARVVLRGPVDTDLRRAAMARVYGEYDDDPAPEHGIRERTTRVWIARGLGVRVEYDGPRAWTQIDPDGPHQIDEGPRQFLEPGPIIPDLRFELTGRDVVAGRDALVLRARPAGGGPGAAHAFGAGADEYELAVDAERGVVLRSVAFLDGREFERSEAVEIAFDEDLPAELFEEEREEDPPEMARMELGQAVSLVPFRVFAPARLGPSWSVTVWHQPAHEWVGPEHLRVELTYGGGAYEAGIGQHAVGATWPHEDDVFEWAPLEEGSEIAVGRCRADEDQPSLRSVVLLRTEREGTSIGISSHTLPLEQLLDLLGRLEPV